LVVASIAYLGPPCARYSALRNHTVRISPADRSESSIAVPKNMVKIIAAESGMVNRLIESQSGTLALLASKHKTISAPLIRGRQCLLLGVLFGRKRTSRPAYAIRK